MTIKIHLKKSINRLLFVLPLSKFYKIKILSVIIAKFPIYVLKIF